MVADIALGALLSTVTLLPLAWKWKFDVTRAFVFVLGLSVAAGAIVEVAGLDSLLDPVPAGVIAWLLTVVAAGSFVLFRFYRDPQRTPPGRADAVVSPADGRVIYVHSSPEGRLPVATKEGRPYMLHELTKTRLENTDAIVVGISLDLLDVHVNRAPVGGRVVASHHHKGSFKSLGKLENLFENERATMVIERGGVQVAVVMIASRLVRRIVQFVKEGQEIAAGARIGAIRLGSQVDVVLPTEKVAAVNVKVGERVKAGETIIALMRLEAPGGGIDASTSAAGDRVHP